MSKTVNWQMEASMNSLVTRYWVPSNPKVRPHTPSIFCVSENIQGQCLTDTLLIQITKTFLDHYRVDISVRDDQGSAHLLEPSLNAKCGYKLKKNYKGDLNLLVSLMACHLYLEGERMLLTIEVEYEQLRNSSASGADVFSFTCVQKELAVKRKVFCEEEYIEVSLKVDIPFQAGLHHAQDQESPWFFEVHYPDGSMINVDQPWILRNGLGLNISSYYGWITLRVPHSSPIVGKKDVFDYPSLAYTMMAKHEELLIGLRYDLSAVCPEVQVRCAGADVTVSVPILRTPASGETVDLVFGIQVDGITISQTDMDKRGFLLQHSAQEVTVTYPKKNNVEYKLEETVYRSQLSLVHMWRDQADRSNNLVVIYLPVETCHPDDLNPGFTVTGNEMGFNITYGPIPLDYIVSSISIDGTISYSLADIAAQGANVTMIKDVNFQYVNVFAKYGTPVVPRKYIGGTSSQYSTTPSFLFLNSERTEETVKETETHTYNRSDVVFPVLHGSCGDERVCFNVSKGNAEELWRFYVWEVPVITTQRGYIYRDHGPSFWLCVGIQSPDLLHRSVTADSRVMALAVSFRDSVTGKTVVKAEQLCTFLTGGELVCTATGEMKARALRISASPAVDLHSLSLRDPRCGPSEVTDNLTSFEFTVNTCGTTKEVHGDYVVYDNEISNKVTANDNTTRHTLYKVTLLCQYMQTDQLSLELFSKYKQSLPKPAQGQGEFKLSLDIMRDPGYTTPYPKEEFPITKLLRDPLFVEVSVLSDDPGIELFLKDCWGTLGADPSSTLKWPVIKDSCEFKGDKYKTVFHQVKLTRRVQLPGHYKRFDVKMFTFIDMQSKQLLDKEIYFHCAVIICDAQALSSDQACSGACIPGKQRRGRGAWSLGVQHGVVSSGGISLQSPADAATSLLDPDTPSWLIIVSVTGLLACLAFMVYAYWRLKLKKRNSNKPVTT
ncbi:hypothetical protein AOXY_G26035 [Acipenser oxyrinchus oxyrinchus]|uniref:ZP domain-containing protein n=1 Tax=Acipenser oxyrinchus oxyrinchus TaxID=40147 RepID=A0AAD8CRJ5_ACIOX|nr:hypothetical protein AOXY_G26035 [Acipenser oxyrinchus oxyrinchus]